jgi:hypothetical protein
MKKDQIERMDYFRGENADDINIESPESIDIAPVEPGIQASVQAKEAASGSIDSNRDEKVELWMKNIKDFIRNIDVKAL